MRKTVLMLLLLMSFITQSQVSFYRQESNYFRPLKVEEVEKVKQLTTVFLLPECYTKEQYAAILKKSWKASPYRIVTAEELDYAMFLSGEYTFAQLNTRVDNYPNMSEILVDYELNFYYLDVTPEKLKKGYDLRKKKEDQDDWIFGNFISYARIPFQAPPEKLLEYTKIYKPGRPLIKEPMKLEIGALARREKAISNFTEGHLLNYFKQLSDIIELGKSYSDFSKDLTAEGKKILKTNTLFVPDYLLKKLKKRTSEFDLRSASEMKQLFSAYQGKYTIIPEEAIGQKIANGEDFYYMRYCFTGRIRFFEIVHSTTGEPIFRERDKMQHTLIPVDFVVMWE